MYETAWVDRCGGLWLNLFITLALPFKSVHGVGDLGIDIRY